jgi:hypothetical protein
LNLFPDTNFEGAVRFARLLTGQKLLFKTGQRQRAIRKPLHAGKPAGKFT